eukprot:gene25709-34286_t
MVSVPTDITEVILYGIPGSDYFDRYCYSPSYFDSTSLTCSYCFTGFSDANSLDGYGNVNKCKCPPGYKKVLNDCSGDTSGYCNQFLCQSCSTAAYADASDCVSCGPTTLGFSRSTSDCTCSVPNNMLVDTDKAGNKLSAKACIACPAGTKVITSDQVIAGKTYTADLTSCQACPDPLMSMSFSLNVYSCSCPSGYTIVGVASIGPQSCIATAIAKSFLQVEAAASKVTYHDSLQKLTLPSLTMQHYFVSAAATCTYIGGPAGQAACQTLANLCVLQMFDLTSQACIAHFAVINNRGSRGFINSVRNWVQSNPWLFFPIPPVGGVATSPCLSNAYRARLNLNKYIFKYTIAAYTMNGTFVGFQELSTFFSYCGKSAPYTNQGGGTSSSSKYQILGYGMNTNYSCELSSLLGKQQLFYELYLFDQVSSKSVPAPVRVINIQSNGLPVNAKYPTFLCDNSDILVRRFFLYDIVSGISPTASNSATLQMIRYASYINVEISLALSPFGY